MTTGELFVPFFTLFTLSLLSKIVCSLCLHANLFMFILLISNHTVFLGQFGINLQSETALAKAARAMSAFWKTHSCKLIPNWTRNRMITYTNQNYMRNLERFWQSSILVKNLPLFFHRSLQLLNIIVLRKYLFTESLPIFDFHSSCRGNWVVCMSKVDGRSMFKDCTMFGRFCTKNWHSLGKSCIESSCP